MADMWRVHAVAAIVDLQAALANKSGLQEAMAHVIDADVNIDLALNELEEVNVKQALKELGEDDG